MTIIRDDSLDDLAKEKAIQKAAINMIKQTLILFSKLVIVAMVSVSPVIIADSLSLIMLENFNRFVLRLDVLLITTVVMLIPVIGFRLKNRN